MGAWEQALIKAARQGYISRGTGSGQVKSNHLVLKANESLLRDLEIPELGQPVALGTVVVRIFVFMAVLPTVGFYGFVLTSYV